MALTAEQARDEQESLAALAIPLAVQAMADLDESDLPTTLDLIREWIEALVDFYGKAAAGAAADWFRELRAEHVSGRFPIPPIADVPPGFIDSAIVDAAASQLSGGVDLIGSRVEQMVLDQGRKQLLSTVAADREARGWARVPNADACSFCLMLAIRAGSGFLYTSRETANFRAHVQQPNGSGGDCRCGVEPVWGTYEPSERVRSAMATWDEATTTPDGRRRSGHDARTAFRQAIEGRPVTGAKDKRPRNRRGERFDAPSGVTPENQRFQLQLLQSLPPAKTPEAAEWRRRRVAEIRKFLGE